MQINDRIKQYRAFDGEVDYHRIDVIAARAMQGMRPHLSVFGWIYWWGCVGTSNSFLRCWVVDELQNSFGGLHELSCGGYHEIAPTG